MLTSTLVKDESGMKFNLEGELVAGNLEDIRDRIKKCIGDGALVITLNMTSVNAIDSAGIGFLAAAHNSLSKAGGSLIVSGLSEDMYNFFISLRLNSHFKLEKR